MSELSIHELEAEHGEVLPARETLSVYHAFNNHVVAVNTAIAYDRLTILSHNAATASQTVITV